ncbi:MAG: TIM44-like domain-containing protein [Spirochaetota bacterium]
MLRIGVLFSLLALLTSFSVYSRPGGGRSYRSSSSSSSSGSSYRSSSSSYRSSSSNSYNNSSSSSSYSSGSTTSYSNKPKPDPYKKHSTSYTILQYGTRLKLLEDSSLIVEEDVEIRPDKKDIPGMKYLLPLMYKGGAHVKIDKLKVNQKTARMSYRTTGNLPRGFADAILEIKKSELSSTEKYNLQYQVSQTVDFSKKKQQFFWHISPHYGNKSQLSQTSFSIEVPLSKGYDTKSIKVDTVDVSGKPIRVAMKSEWEGQELKGQIVNPRQIVLLRLTLPKGYLDPYNISYAKKGLKHFLKKVEVRMKVRDDSILEISELLTYKYRIKVKHNRKFPKYLFFAKEYFVPEMVVYGQNFTPEPKTYSRYSYSGALNPTWVFGEAVKGKQYREQKLTLQYKQYGSIYHKPTEQYLLWSFSNEDYVNMPVEKMKIDIEFPHTISPKKIVWQVKTQKRKTRVLRKINGNTVQLEVQNIPKGDRFELIAKLPSASIDKANFFLSAYIMSLSTYREYNVLFKLGFSLLGLIFGIVALTKGMSKLRKKRRDEFAIQREEKERKEQEQLVSFAKDPKFSLDDFLQKIHYASKTLIGAWLSGNMSRSRSVVSSGIYNRFRVQLRLMQEQGVVNVMKDHKISSLRVLQAVEEGPLQTIHVRYTAEARDLNLPLDLSQSEKAKRLAATPLEWYTEIWSFVRQTQAQTELGKGLHLGTCPNCGSKADNLGESVKCGSCGSLYNSGEHDWVLAEITQEVEWKGAQGEFAGFYKLREQNPKMSVQQIEDRCSYIFWKWIETCLQDSPQPLRRDLASNLQGSFAAKKKNLFDMAVGAVDLKKIQVEGNVAYSHIQIKWSAADAKGQEPYYRETEFTLAYEDLAKEVSGFAEHSCESCGSPLPESDASQCSYCGASISAISNDWMLYAIREK